MKMSKSGTEPIAIFIPGGMGHSDDPGAIPHLVNLITALSGEADITVYSLTRPADPAFMAHPQFRFRYANAGPDGLLFRRSGEILLRFIRDHLRKKYRTVHGFWGLPAGMLAVVTGKIFGIPSIVSLQGGETAAIPHIRYGNLLFSRRRKLTLWTCRQATKLCVLTFSQKDALRKAGILRREIAVIPYGADPAFKANEIRQPSRPLKILHVAHLNEVKDQHTLLKAFRLISREADAELRIIGRDFLNSEIQKFAKQLGLDESVQFTGWVPYRDLPHYYRQADVMLHTSLHEAQAVSVTNALAAGLVIGGTAVGIFADLPGKAAIAVASGDYRTLAREILTLIRNPDRCRQMQQAAREWALRNPFAKTVERYLTLYHSFASDFAEKSAITSQKKLAASPGESGVSVVIPTRNRKKSLERLLLSLQRQTCLPREVIIVDAGSGFSGDWNGRFPGLHISRYISPPSVCRQRNLGVRKATAARVLLCDDDMELAPDYLERLAYYAQNHPDTPVVSGLILQRDGENGWAHQYPPASLKGLWGQFIFQLSVWGDVSGFGKKGISGMIARPLLRFYAWRGNSFTFAGWPLITRWDEPVFHSAIYGLGASLVQREWLRQHPFDENLDTHGIGDNYGLAIQLPPERPVAVVRDARAYHHQSGESRLPAAVTDFRRILALDYFMRKSPRFTAINRMWFIWSMVGRMIIQRKNPAKLAATRQALRLIPE